MYINFIGEVVKKNINEDKLELKVMTEKSLNIIESYSFLVRKEDIEEIEAIQIDLVAGCRENNHDYYLSLFQKKAGFFNSLKRIVVDLSRYDSSVSQNFEIMGYKKILTLDSMLR